MHWGFHHHHHSFSDTPNFPVISVHQWTADTCKHKLLLNIIDNKNLQFPCCKEELQGTYPIQVQEGVLLCIDFTLLCYSWITWFEQLKPFTHIMTVVVRGFQGIVQFKVAHWKWWQELQDEGLDCTIGLNTHLTKAFLKQDWLVGHCGEKRYKTLSQIWTLDTINETKIFMSMSPSDSCHVVWKEHNLCTLKVQGPIYIFLLIAG